MIRHLEWLPGHGPPAVGWGWTSRLLYRGFPPPLLPSGTRTAHGLTGPLDPCPPNFAGAPALTGDSWVRGNYSSLPSLSPCLGAERGDGSHLYLPFFQRPPFRSSPRLGARCIAGFLPYLPFFPPALPVLPHGGSHVSASLATRTFADMRHRPFLCGETTSAGSDRRVGAGGAIARAAGTSMAPRLIPPGDALVSSMHRRPRRAADSILPSPTPSVLPRRAPTSPNPLDASAVCPLSPLSVFRLCAQVVSIGSSPPSGLSISTSLPISTLSSSHSTTSSISSTTPGVAAGATAAAAGARS